VAIFTAIVVGASKLTTLSLLQLAGARSYHSLPSSWNIKNVWGTVITSRFARSPACDLFHCRLHLPPPAAYWCGPRSCVYCKRFTLYSCSTMNTVEIWAADAVRSGRAVLGMNCFRPLELWGRGFESHSRHACVRLFCVCVVLCVGSGLETADPLSKEAYRMCIGLRN
jgi:hypothetical protein